MTTDPQFEQRLADAKAREQMSDAAKEEAETRAAQSSGLAVGMRIGLEFVSGTLVGMAMGYGLDRWLDSSPWFLLIFTLLGFAAGMLNVYRSLMGAEEGIGINRSNVLTKGRETPKN